MNAKIYNGNVQPNPKEYKIWVNDDGLIKTWNGTEWAEQNGGSSQTKWTGHADVEGLKAIGWTDEDIAYYQANGVNWNEEDDQYHKVPEDNIALYGVLTPYNISTYKDRIVYLPKIDTSNVTDMNNMFYSCYTLVSIPKLDTSSVTNMYCIFSFCYSLVSIPRLDTSKVKNMSRMFYKCYSLVSIPQLDTSSVTDMSQMLSDCSLITSIPQIDTSEVTNMYNMFYNCFSLVSIPKLDTSKVLDMGQMFYYCYAIVSIPQLDTSTVTNMNNMFSNCFSAQIVNLKGMKVALNVSTTQLFTKDSLLYIINNESAAKAITIKLSSYCYTKYSTDADVVAALANHPNISIAS